MPDLRNRVPTSTRRLARSLPGQVATTEENVMRVWRDFERPNIRTTGFNLGYPVTT